jgi:hypothetical protein
MDFTTWLNTWLTRHPLKEPTHLNPADYTAQVMAKVNALTPPSVEAPVSSPIRLWRSWPRLALVGASVATGVLLVLGRINRSQVQLVQEAQGIDRDAQLLTELGEPLPLPSEDAEGIEELAQELHANDTVMLAESTSSDDQWLEETLQLLDQLNEDLPATDAGESSDDEEWLNELQMLDEDELSSRS